MVYNKSLMKVVRCSHVSSNDKFNKMIKNSEIRKEKKIKITDIFDFRAVGKSLPKNKKKKKVRKKRLQTKVPQFH